MENFSLTKKEVEKISGNTYLIRFNEWIDFEPMQFVMVETPNSVVRKPFGLGSWQGDLALCVEILGEGTKYIVHEAVKLNVHGPCGNDFVPPNKNGLIIAAASCLAMAHEAFKRWDVEVLMCSREEFEMDVRPFRKIVGDESFLKTLRELKGYDWYLTLGSPQMCRIAYGILKTKGEVFTTMDSYMACGIGACRGCAIETKEGLKHVCIDGPIFRGDVVWI
ncbi:iron-sulfur cluster-binding protein [Pseudothermotoga thermarum]|uniref:Dihydroorotate dehydrogenase, electron transfer subunit, iron-sulfur cluster binding domain protein n=1 Tax=Pseudothermotoga thermarum DSM 5069 TaxID=688269 RepID=F7YWH2_9THEM|nr:oxidoreductase [Pseudothermotoga thermarum]AEH51951.1 Dihydroorotate dehydrogenase, electron transfer subunit, iron-sulfur cluster binding domain protein [Pseudothermotoga thermarum DSM 5069]